MKGREPSRTRKENPPIREGRGITGGEVIGFNVFPVVTI